MCLLEIVDTFLGLVIPFSVDCPCQDGVAQSQPHKDIGFWRSFEQEKMIAVTKSVMLPTKQPRISCGKSTVKRLSETLVVQPQIFNDATSQIALDLLQNWVREFHIRSDTMLRFIRENQK
jgi:hypothetical protein